MNRSVTRASLITPAGRGAIASIAVEGPNAVSVVESLFSSASRRRLAEYPIDQIFYGTWKSTGEDVVVARRSDSRVEVHCHGGAAASTAILATLAEAECAILSWQDFVRSDAASPTRAAARIALAEASTERTAAILLDQYHGALDAAIEQSIDDFQQGRATAGLVRLGELSARAAFGEHLTRPWRVVIAGPPNAGKSTLMNALVGYERAIVFDQPGTTRDVLTAPTAIDGWPIELSDTAGLRAADEPLEQAGVLRAQAELRKADLVVWVFDITQRWSDELSHVAAESPRALVVHNKVDLLASEHAGNRLADRPPGVQVSARSGWNVADLLAAIAKRIVPIVPPHGAPVPFLSDQTGAIQSAIKLAEQGLAEQAMAVQSRLVARVDAE